MRALLALWLLALSLSAEPIALSAEELSRDLIGLGAYVIDKRQQLSPQAVLEAEDLQPLVRSNHGYDQRLYWVRYRFENSGDRPLSAVLYNPRPGMQFIDVHLFGPQGYAHYPMGVLSALDKRSLKSIFSNVRLDLAPGEQMEVVIAMQTFGVMEAAWQLEGLEAFYAIESRQLMVLLFFAVFLLTLVFKNLLLYGSVRERLYLFYSLFLVSNVLFNSTVGGLSYLLLSDWVDNYLLSSMGWVMAMLASSFVWIFTYLFFLGSGPVGLLRNITIAIVVLNTAVVLIFAYGFVADMTLLRFTPLALLLGYSESVLLFIIAVVMFIKRRPGSGYFMLAHLFYVASIVSFLMLLDGTVRQSLFVSHLPLFGTMATAFLMSISLSSRLKALKQQNSRYLDQIQRNEHFVTIGSSVYFIVHQWKQPLSALSALVLRLQHLIEQEPQKPLASLGRLADRIEDRVGQMNESMNSAREFFTKRLSHEEAFSLREQFRKIRLSLSERLSAHAISLEFKGGEKLWMDGNANLFLNAFLNLINNSIDAIIAVRPAQGVITVTTCETPEGIVVSIEDNGGGIDPAILKRIFEPFNTSKRDGTGIGLVLSKNILQDYFGATLNFETDTKGTRLSVVFGPKKAYPA